MLSTCSQCRVRIPGLLNTAINGTRFKKSRHEFMTDSATSHVCGAISSKVEVKRFNVLIIVFNVFSIFSAFNSYTHCVSIQSCIDLLESAANPHNLAKGANAVLMSSIL